MYYYKMVPKKKEEEENKPLNFLDYITGMMFMLVSLYSLYLSFKINKGVSWSIIPALFFPPIYLVYVFAVHGSKPFKTSFK